MLQELTQPATIPAWRLAAEAEWAKAELEQSEKKRRTDENTKALDIARRQKQAEQLKIALKCLGINSDPAGPSVTIDGYQFTLSTWAEIKSGLFSFSLRIGRQLPTDDKFLFQTLSTPNYVSSDSDFSSVLGDLAMRLARLDADYEE